MKKVGLVIGVGLVAIVAIAVATAGQMGETSHAVARGRIVLDDGLRDQAKGIETLFIIALGRDRPMPLGAFKKTIGAEPEGELYDFVLTKDNMQLMPGAMGGEFPDSFKLKARLDKDGVAGPDQPGDLVGEIALVQRGEGGLTLTIDRLVQ